MGGSFWTRIRLGKAVAGPGVRGQDDRDKWKQTCFFLGLGIQTRRLAPKVRPLEACFGPELDWEKLFGALPTTSTTTMGLLGFGPPLVVCFCSSAATRALRHINARSTKQGSIGDDDFV